MFTARIPRAIALISAALCLGTPALGDATGMVDPVGPSDGKDIRKTLIADGIYQFTTWRDAYVRQLNSVVIVNRDDVLVFDTNTRPSCARAIIAEIRKITSKPVRFVVNSHWHPDHWSGNEVFAQAWPGLTILATTKAAETMRNVSPTWPRQFAEELRKSRAGLEQEIRDGKQADGTPLTPELRRKDDEDVRNYATFVDECTRLHRVFPTLTYDDRLTLVRGDREFRFMEVVGDAIGSTVLYLPKEKILVTGDAVSYPIPYSAMSTSRHAATLRELSKLDVDVIIPGHGPAFHDKQYLDLESQLLDTIVQGVRDELRKGPLSLEEVQKAITAEDLREKFTHGDRDLDARFRDRVKAIVKNAVREARGGTDLPQ
jgi:glyoxylase-like metal-dependent hydrolase (beta-lactamase superfamily II)